MNYRWTFVALGLLLLLAAHAIPTLNVAQAEVTPSQEYTQEPSPNSPPSSVVLFSLLPTPTNQTPAVRASDLKTLLLTAEAAAELAKDASSSAQAFADAITQDEKSEAAMAQARADALAQAADQARAFVSAVSEAKASVDAQAQAMAQVAAEASEKAQASAQAAAEAEVRIKEEFTLVVDAASHAEVAASASASAAAAASAQADEQAQAAATAASEANARAAARATASADASAEASKDASESAQAVARANASAQAVAALQRQARDSATAADAKVTEAEDRKDEVINKEIRPEVPCVDVLTKIEGTLTAVGNSVTEARASASSSAEAVAQAAAFASASAQAASFAVAQAQSHAQAASTASSRATATASAIAKAWSKAVAEANAQANASAEAKADAQAAADAAAKALGKAKAELQASLEVIASARAEAQASAQAAAEAAAEASAQAQAAAQAMAEAVSKAEASAVAIADAAAEASAQAAALAEALARATAKAASSAEAAAEAAASAQAAAQAAAQAEIAEDVPELIAEVQIAVDAAAEASAGAQASAEAVVEVKTAVSASADAIAKAQATAQAEAQASADTLAQVQAQATALAQASAAAQAKASADAHAAATAVVDARAEVSAHAQAAATALAEAQANASAAATAEAKAEVAVGASARAVVQAETEASAQASAQAEASANAGASAQATATAGAAAFAQADAAASVEVAARAQTQAAASAFTSAETSVKLISDVSASTTATVKPECLQGTCPRLPILSVNAIGPVSRTTVDVPGDIAVNIAVTGISGSPKTTPFSQAVAPDTPVSLTAPSPITVNNRTLTFSEWRRNGASFSSNARISLTLSDQNESLTAVYQASAPQLPDLTVDATFSPSNPTVGDTLTFTVTVKNSGVADAGRFEVALTDSITSTRTTLPVSSQRAGASSSLSFTRKLDATSQTFTFKVDPNKAVAESNENNNEKVVTVTGRPVPQLPDLVIPNVTFAPNPAPAGSSVTFSVFVKNQGQGDAAGFTVSLTDSSSTINQFVSSLAAGAPNAIVTFTRPVGSASQTFTFRVDPNNRIQESNENNNQYSLAVSPQTPRLPDLTVSATRSPTGNPQVGTTLTFDVTVSNVGQGDAGSFSVEVRSPNGVSSQGVSTLRAGSTSRVSLNRPCGSASETFTVKVDPDNRVSESNENNNQATLNVSCQQVVQIQHLTWEYGTLRGGSFTISSRSMPSDLSNSIANLSAQQSRLVSSTLPSGVTFSLDLAKRSGSLTGTFPNAAASHTVVFDLLNSGGQKVADLTITIAVTGSGPACCTLTFEAIADSGTSQTPISVPITLGGCAAGSRNTPFTADCAQGAALSAQAPSSITTGGLSLAFQHWLSNGVVLTTSASFSGTVNRTETLTAVYRGAQPTTSSCNTEFSGSSLDSAFSMYLPVDNDDPPLLSLTANPGHLRLEIPIRGTVTLDHWSSVDRAPQLRCTAPSGNWELTTRMRVLEPSGGDYHVGLMVVFSQFDLFYWGMYQGRELRLERSGVKGILSATPSCGTVSCANLEVELMIAKNGNTYSFSYRFVGSNTWTLVGSQTATQAPQFIGLIGKTWSPEHVIADFDYVHVQAR